MLNLWSTRIYEDPTMTVPGEPRTVRRSWRERLLSRPWRPWRRTETVVPWVPDPHLVRFGDRIIGHPATVAELRRHLDELDRTGVVR